MPLPVLKVSFLDFICLLSLHNNNAVKFHTCSAYQCQTLQKLMIQILSPQLLLEKGQNILPVQTTKLPGAFLQLSHPFTVSIWMLTKFPRTIIPNLLSHSLSLESHLFFFFPFSVLNDLDSPLKCKLFKEAWASLLSLLHISSLTNLLLPVSWMGNSQIPSLQD